MRDAIDCAHFPTAIDAGKPANIDRFQQRSRDSKQDEFAVLQLCGEFAYIFANTEHCG